MAPGRAAGVRTVISAASVSGSSNAAAGFPRSLRRADELVAGDTIEVRRRLPLNDRGDRDDLARRASMQPLAGQDDTASTDAQRDHRSTRGQDAAMRVNEA